MAGERSRDPKPKEIALMCAAFQALWTDQQKLQRMGRVLHDEGHDEPAVRQFYVHHYESGKWLRGGSRMASVWRSV